MGTPSTASAPHNESLRAYLKIMSLRAAILNFHGVGPISRSISPGEQSCWLDLAQFRRVLDLVAEKPSIEITFDDGNASDFLIALPELLERRLKATFFISTALVGQPSYITNRQIAILKEHGMAIGSHGHHHVPWTRLSRPILQQELETSRAMLSETCASPVTVAACPFGAYNRRVLQTLILAGYQTVYTSDGGYSRPGRFLRARTTITRSLSGARIAKLSTFQLAFRLRVITGLKTLIKRVS